MRKKVKIINILTILIMSLMILILISIKVDASQDTNRISFESVKQEQILTGADVSDRAAPSVRIFNVLIPLLSKILFIISIALLIYGIKVIVKNKQKRGIIYIILFLMALWASVMLDAIVIHDHNIMP